MQTKYFKNMFQNISQGVMYSTGVADSETKNSWVACYICAGENEEYLEFKAESGSKILVIYDYEYTPLGDDSYDITQYRYALIEKSDLYAGNGIYEPIKMIGKGC